MLKYFTKSLVIVAASMLISPALLYAHGDENHATEAQEESAKIPDKAEDIWKKIDEEVMLLNKAITDNTLDKVHHHAFAIRDLITALPEHSPALSAKQIEQVKANIKYVSMLADRLDESGDKNDKAATEANVVKLQKIIDNLRSNYPNVPKNT